MAGKKKAAKALTRLKATQVEDLLDNLYELYKNLDALDPVKMSAADNEKWNEQYVAVTDAIRVLRTKALADINAALTVDADKLVAAIERAEDALHGVRDKAKILEAVGNAFKFIAAIAAIL